MKIFNSLLVISITLTMSVGAAVAQTDPGATVSTHHETVPNPVYNSAFRVASSCKAALVPCAWESSTTWVSGRAPEENTQVIVDGNVRISSQNAVALAVGVYPGGTLSFTPAANTRLRTGDLVVFAGGTLLVGSENEPIRGGFVAEIVIRNLPFAAEDLKKHLRGIVVLDGTIKVHGRPLSETFIRTAIEPLQNANTVSLTVSANVAGWKIGDTLVLPKSSQCRDTNRIDCPDETEERTLTAISSDGKTLTLSSPLQFAHPGGRDSKGNLDFLPHVLNKTRNVIIRSEDPNGTRGHILLHSRSYVDIRYASIIGLGRTNIENLGSENQKGRYPLHAHHLIGPQSPQPNGRQFTLLGNVVDFGPENYQQNRKWGIAIHGSHFGLIERNICDRASGAGIVTEDADPGDKSKLGRAGVGYWFNGGGNNTFEDNVAAAVAECTYCYGFKFDNMMLNDLTIPASQGANPMEGGGQTVDPYNIGITHFQRNETYAVPNGLTIWWVCTEHLTPSDTCSSTVKDFRVWNHHRWGYFGYQTNQLLMDGFTQRGVIDKSHTPSTAGLYLGDYMTRKMTIRNADIQGTQTAIFTPSFNDVRGATGPSVGIFTIEDSFLSAQTNIAVRPPYSTNGPTGLPPQTTIVRNVRFEHPAGLQGPNIDVRPLNSTNERLDLRNDVRVYNSNVGNDISTLYMIPAYQAPTWCDSSIGNCSQDITGSFTTSQVTDLRVYSLLSTTSPSPGLLPPVAPSGLAIQ
jgi:G8 domain-containing protein